MVHHNPMCVREENQGVHCVRTRNYSLNNGMRAAEQLTHYILGGFEPEAVSGFLCEQY